MTTFDRIRRAAEEDPKIEGMTIGEIEDEMTQIMGADGRVFRHTMSLRLIALQRRLAALRWEGGTK